MEKQYRYGENGFTLIELLVVVAILGVLAAIVILNVARYMWAGQNESAATELVNVQTAVTAYMYDHSGARPSMSEISPYFIGTPHGTYTIDSVTGKVSQTNYP